MAESSLLVTRQPLAVFILNRESPNSAHQEQQARGPQEVMCAGPRAAPEVEAGTPHSATGLHARMAGPPRNFCSAVSAEPPFSCITEGTLGNRKRRVQSNWTEALRPKCTSAKMVHDKSCPSTLRALSEAPQ